MKLVLYRLWRKFRHVEYWLVAQLAFVVLALLSRLPPKQATDFADWIARKIGPVSPRHGVALYNLRYAFPEKSEDAINRIALDMWGNMARLVSEYVFLDQIFDYDPHAEKPGLIEVEGLELFKQVRDAPGPHLFFTAHTGNFELLPL